MFDTRYLTVMKSTVELLLHTECGAGVVVASILKSSFHLAWNINTFILDMKKAKLARWSYGH